MALHKALADDGLDAGAATIHFHLAQRSTPTSFGLDDLSGAQGQGVRHPLNRRSVRRARSRGFVADLPNETWQADMTHVEFGGGQVYEVLNMIDDHSRLCVASRAMKVVKANDVVRVLAQSGRELGLPGLLPQRQRAHLLHAAPPPGGRGHRTRALRPRHRGQARPALPPTDLWKGRALPPDHEEVLGHAGSSTAAKQLQRQLDRFVAVIQRESDRTGASGARHRQPVLPRPGEGRALLRHSSRWARGGCALTGSTKPAGSRFVAGAASPHRNRERLRRLACRHAH